LCAIKLTVLGNPAPAPALLVSNHQSYLDVIALGASAHMCFTPKSDVAGWPLIGALIREFGVVFVSRERTRAKEVMGDLMRELEAGRRMCVFPEGTTNDGRSLLPFKASPFSLCERWQEHHPAPLAVQPLSVIYETLDGQPIIGDAWDTIAWYGDMDFFPHLWGVMQRKSITMRLEFHPVVAIDNADRKALAAFCEKRVRESLPALYEVPVI
jgi:1-acyl-sn-glycerol-3-phosphate acyltransferase